jgi:hypothetical protein
MNYALASMGSDSIDALAIGRHWSDKFARSLRQALQLRESRRQDFIDVHYNAIATDPMETVRGIYAQLDWPLSEETQASMRVWLQANRREDRNPHHYTLEQFGFTRAALEKDFAEYRAAFVV